MIRGCTDNLEEIQTLGVRIARNPETGRAPALPMAAR